MRDFSFRISRGFTSGYFLDALSAQIPALPRKNKKTIAQKKDFCYLGGIAF
jgi:hypothetical protein